MRSDVTSYNNIYQPRRRKGWQEFYTAYWLLGREADLQRLVVWAARKRLTKPCQAYQNRLDETQAALTRIRRFAPRIWTLASLSFRITDWLFLVAQYHIKGSAAAYRQG